MAYESKWFPATACICVLTMDPDASGLTWSDVQDAINAGGVEARPAGVRYDQYGLPDEGVDLAQYAETCKVESIRLAEHEASMTMTPPVVLLRD